MPPAKTHTSPTTAPAATMAIVIAALYFGRDILVPLALGTLLAFILTPLVTFLRRYWVPKIAAIIVAVGVALALFSLITYAVAAQLVQLANDLPTYQSNIAAKIERVQTASPAGTVFARAAETLRALDAQLGRRSGRPSPDGPSSRSAPTTSVTEPIPVVVQAPPLRPLDILQKLVAPLMGPLGTAGLVVVFVVFILLEREELRDRFIHLFGGDDMQRSTQLISDAATRVSRFLLMQLVVNITYGIPVGIGLALIGVPNAMLWGVLAAVLRFIPYLGPWLAAVFPVVLALGSEPGWSMVAWTIALFAVLELASNNFAEPWLYGTSTGLSSFAIILAAIFWTVLWGPLGLFLSTPLTVCLVVIGRHVPRLAFLDVMLGASPVLSTAERFHQRLVAGDVDEALAIAEEEIEGTSVQVFYDDIALAALLKAECQKSSRMPDRGELTTNVATVLRELGSEKQDASRSGRRFLCIAGRTELDLAAATVLALRLEELGHVAETRKHTALLKERIGELELNDVEIIFLCHLSETPAFHARYAYRRLVHHGSHRVVLCIFNPKADLDFLRGEFGDDDVAICGSIKSVEDMIHRHLQPRTT